MVEAVEAEVMFKISTLKLYFNNILPWSIILARGTKRGRKPKVVVLEEETNEVVEAAKVEVKDLEPLPIAAVTPTLEEIEMQIDVKEVCIIV